MCNEDPRVRARSPNLQLAQGALDQLHASSPITLRSLAATLLVQPCAACVPGDDPCDGCTARGALATLCLTLAARAAGEG